MELVINGRFDEAFSHLLVVGLASILEDADERRICEIRWTGRTRASITTSDDLIWETAATVVRDHARRWRDSSWIGASDVYAEPPSSGKSGASGKSGKNAVSAERATLSPRLGTPGSDRKWRLLERNRARAIDDLHTNLDRRYVGALGEPSYWSGDMAAAGYTPDRGATRWEMVTRNRGQEFISGRLQPLAEAVAARSVRSVADGLQGKTVVDEAGKGKSDSRTPTGLRLPSLTDNAQAWCALFGVSAFPVMKGVAARRGATAAFLQLPRHGSYAVLPVWRGPWTLQHYRAVVRSRALLTVGLDAVLDNGGTDRGKDLDKDREQRQRIGLDAATLALNRRWLRDKGVEYAMLFPQFVSSNASAPERWLQKGDIVLLAGEAVDHG